MKKVVFIILQTVFFFQCNAQKDTTKREALKRDTVIVLSYKQANSLIQDIQIQQSGKADIKPEQWESDLQMIYKSVRIIPNDKEKTTK